MNRDPQVEREMQFELSCRVTQNNSEPFVSTVVHAVAKAVTLDRDLHQTVHLHQEPPADDNAGYGSWVSQPEALFNGLTASVTDASTTRTRGKCRRFLGCRRCKILIFSSNRKHRPTSRAAGPWPKRHAPQRYYHGDTITKEKAGWEFKSTRKSTPSSGRLHAGGTRFG